MEKYGQDDTTLLLNLRNEEAQLMQEIQALTSRSVKTAAEQQKFGDVGDRLQLVRSKITEMDKDLVKED